MEIYVIRHTQVAVGKNICYGQSDVALVDSFDTEAAQFKVALPSDFDTVFSSPMQRCVKLAESLDLKEMVLEKALLEMNFGDWENHAWNDLNQTDLNAWMEDFVTVKTPNGENLLELSARVFAFLESLRSQPQQKILLVTHAGVIRCIWAYLLSIPLKNIFKIPVAHGEILHFTLATQKEWDSIRRMS